MEHSNGTSPSNNLPKSRYSLLLLTILAIGAASAAFASPGTGANPQVNWASLHGADAFFSGNGLFLTSQGTESPSLVFSQMKSLGFNFARVPISWTSYASNPSAFTSELTSVLNNADSNGISVVLDFHQILGFDVFPNNMLTAYNSAGGAQPGYNNMMSDWWNNKATYSWQNMVDQFWKPVIQTADSHTSVVGYEIMNEPPLVSGMTVSNMQQHNQFFATAIRGLTSKAIVFMGAYNCAGCGGGGSASQVEPTGIANLVLDIHNYGLAPDFSSANGVTGLSGVFIGEWGPSSGCGSVIQSTEQSTIAAYYAAFRAFGYGNSYWIWRQPFQSTTIGSCDLLDSNNNPNWITNMLSQAIGSTATTTTTSSSATSSTTTSKTTTSTSTTASTSKATTYTTSSSSSLPSCSPTNVCLTWGYVPSTVVSGVASQWQGLVHVRSGMNPVGIPISWYLDGSLAYSTTTSQGGGPTQGTSYYNARLTAGTHTLCFAVSGAQSSTLNIVVGGTTTTSTTSTTSSSSTVSTSTSTSTSITPSTTTTYLSPPSSSSYSSSYTTSSSVDQNSSTSSSVVTGSTETVGGSTVTSSSSSSTQNENTHAKSSHQTTATSSTDGFSPTQTQDSPNPQTSAFLFPTLPSMAIVSGTMGLILVALVTAVRLRYHRKR